MRNEKRVTITAEGRDNGKTFLLTEMAATAAEKWGMRALLAIGRSGVDIPEDVARSGMAGFAALGVRALMSVDFADAEPLLDEMMGCVQIVETHAVRRPTPDDIEEVATLLLLRSEVLDLHLGFSLAGRLQRLTLAIRGALSPSTPASPPSSEP